MTTRLTTKTLSRAALPGLALALGACAVRYSDDRFDDPPYGGTDVVVESAAPQRVYYHDPQDTVNVYYYDAQRPDVVVYRPIYRERDGRTYYIERERGVDRRFYYDDARARAYRPDRDGHHDRDHDQRTQVVVAPVVVQTSAPQRVHYRDPNDTVNVYYFDQRHPEIVVNRRVLRENDGRTYYVEHEGGADHRYYYDDDAARKHHPDKDHGPDKDKGHGDKDEDHGPDKDHR